MEIVKKKLRNGKTNRYSFPATDDMKAKLDELKFVNKVDVNEMLRQFSEKLIDSVSKESA